MIHAEQVGRQLKLTFGQGDDASVYLVAPLPARVGRELSVAYLGALVDENFAAEDFGQHLVTAVGKENYDRAEEDLREEEMQALLMAAFNWQTAGGMTGVQIAIGNETNEAGDTGPKAATRRLVSLLGPLLSQISRRSALANPTNGADTPPTTTPDGGPRAVKQPSDRRKPQTKAKAKASQTSPAPKSAESN